MADAVDLLVREGRPILKAKCSSEICGFRAKRVQSVFHRSSAADWSIPVSISGGSMKYIGKVLSEIRRSERVAELRMVSFPMLTPLISISSKEEQTRKIVEQNISRNSETL